MVVIVRKKVCPVVNSSRKVCPPFMDRRRFSVRAHRALEFFAVAFMTGVKTGFFRSAPACVTLASWAANKELNLLRASSVEFNVCFFLRDRMRPGSVYVSEVICRRQGRMMIHSARYGEVGDAAGRSELHVGGNPLYAGAFSASVQYCTRICGMGAAS